MERSEPLRILMLGDGTVGKSQLLTRYLESRFDPNFIVTIGVNCQHVLMPHSGKQVRLQIWDAAGQERFRTITPAYYAKAHAVMIVYDITNHSSFKNVEYWKQQVDAHAGHGGARLPVVIVGNKTDLIDEYTISLRVPKHDEEQLSGKLGVPVRPASAKQGNGVDDAFNELISLAEEHRLSQTGQTFFEPKLFRKAAFSRARNSLVQYCRWPLPSKLSKKRVFSQSDPKQQTAHNPSLKSQSSGPSSTGAPIPKLLPLATAKLGLKDEAEAEPVDSGGGGGQSPVQSSQAENRMTGAVTSYWIRIGPPDFAE